MRRRSFQPEAPGPLEERSWPSGVGRAAFHPVVFSVRQYGLVTQRIRASFASFARFRQDDILREDLANVSMPIPFARADGLPEVIDETVDQMQRNLAAHVPFAVRTAQREFIATIRADVEARVRAGDVVLR
ncbi:hypothetical protein [Paludisphaera soli]|uniref:hypothetical protein n=1 Tax=Paludisphaera soli TaxID=2712865 RepID=UPI0013ECB41F|nr:hypothetical protein [Paludisphaera soli]